MEQPNNRAERRAAKYGHNTGGVVFTNRAARGNKGKGKVKPFGRVSLDTNPAPAPYNADKAK